MNIMVDINVTFMGREKEKIKFKKPFYKLYICTIDQ